jgi:hypothetical protein
MRRGQLMTSSRLRLKGASETPRPRPHPHDRLQHETTGDRLNHRILNLGAGMQSIERGAEKWPEGVSDILGERITNNAYVQLTEALMRAKDGKATEPVDIEVLRSFMEWNKEHADKWTGGKP